MHVALGQKRSELRCVSEELTIKKLQPPQQSHSERNSWRAVVSRRKKQQTVEPVVMDVASLVRRSLLKEAVQHDQWLLASRQVAAVRDPSRVYRELIALDERLRKSSVQKRESCALRCAAEIIYASLCGQPKNVQMRCRRVRLRAALLRDLAWLDGERQSLADEAAVVLKVHSQGLIARHGALRRRLRASRSKAEAENWLVAGHRLAPKAPNMGSCAVLRSEQQELLTVEQRLRGLEALELAGAFRAPLAGLPGERRQRPSPLRTSAALAQIDALLGAARRAVEHEADTAGRGTTRRASEDEPATADSARRELPTTWAGGAAAGERRRLAALKARGVARTSAFAALEMEQVIALDCT